MNSTVLFLIVITVLALLCPSAYTIAWSKGEHGKDMVILYAGLGISALCLYGGFTNNMGLMWFGLWCAVGLFGYVIFVYGQEEKFLEWIS